MDYREKLREHVGRRILELRERGGFRQDDIAEAIGTTTSNYQRIEYGAQNMTLDTMAKIARALEVEVAELFAPIENPGLGTRRPRRRVKTKAKP